MNTNITIIKPNVTTITIKIINEFIIGDLVSVLTFFEGNSEDDKK